MKSFLIVVFLIGFIIVIVQQVLLRLHVRAMRIKQEEEIVVVPDAIASAPVFFEKSAYGNHHAGPPS